MTTAYDFVTTLEVNSFYSSLYLLSRVSLYSDFYPLLFFSAMMLSIICEDSSSRASLHCWD
jgi:hypothetical protein